MEQLSRREVVGVEDNRMLGNNIKYSMKCIIRKEIVWRFLLVIVIASCINICITSCGNKSDDGSRTVYLSRCVVYDHNDKKMLIQRGDSATLIGKDYLLINNRHIKVDDNFVNQYCYENINSIKSDISVIPNNNGNGEYVKLEKDRDFEGKCGESNTGNVTFSGAKFECFATTGENCGKHTRPLLILGSSTYHPISSVSSTDLPPIKIEEANKPIMPEDFFIYDDTLFVRFKKNDSLAIRIFYGLQTKVVKDLTADGNLHAISIVNDIDTFRISCPNRLSYLICATHPHPELVVFEDKEVSKIDSLNGDLSDNTQNFPWYIWLCIIVVVIELIILLLVIVRKIISSSIVTEFIKKYVKSTEQNVKIKRFQVPDRHPLAKVKFITRKTEQKGNSTKVMLCGMIQIVKTDALSYIEYLFENYYPKKDQALYKYLEDQITSSKEIDESDSLTLNIPFYIEDYLENDSEDTWKKNKKLGGYRKSLPNIDAIHSDVQHENSGNVIIFDLQNSESRKGSSWENLEVDLTKLSGVVSEELKPSVNAIRDNIDIIKKEHEDSVKMLRQSLKEAADSLSKQEILLGTERSKNKQLNTELEKLQHDFNDKLKEKVAAVKEELAGTKEMLDLTNRNLKETNSQLESLKREHKSLSDKHQELTIKKKAVDSELSNIKTIHKTEIEKQERQHKEAMDKAERNYQSSLKHQQEEFDRAMADYARLFRRYGGCESYTHAACEFLNALSLLQQEQVKMSRKIAAKSLDETEMDTFNYYYTAVTNKFHKAVDGLDIEGLSTELTCLDETSMTRTDKVLDQILKTSTPEKYVEDLRYRVYDSLFKRLCGAAIVLSDDLGSLNRLCPKAASSADVEVFSKITKTLLKATHNMGYNPVYVELFTPYSDYAEISVEKTVNLEGTNKNDITEVLEMAVNYGTQQSKTKVSANI